MKIEHDKTVHISAILDKLKFKVIKGALSIADIGPIQKPYLIKHLGAYHIPLSHAKKYLAELCIYNHKSGKHFHALGFKNDEDGYEICNEIIKGYVDSRATTFIQGKDRHSKAINIIQDAADFLSLATGSQDGRLKNDTLILNSLSLWQQVKLCAYNQRYKVAYSWLNNTPGSLRVRDKLGEFLETEGIRHIPMNNKYVPQSSVTTWRLHTLAKGQK